MSEETIHVEEEFTAEGKGKTWTEEVSVAGHELLDTLKKLIKEAAVRKITVKDDNDKTLLEIPLYAGIAGVVVLGPWTAAALVAAWVADLTIEIERVDLKTEAAKAEPAAEAVDFEPEPYEAGAEAEPARCQAITKSGTQCKRTAAEGSEFCSIHQPK